MSLRERLVAPDRYGLLLLLIVGTIVAMVALSGTPWERLVAVALAGTTLLVALHTSRASGRLRRIAFVVVPLIVVGAGVVDRADGISRAPLSGAITVLLLAVLAAILRRLGTHLTITWTTVLGAVCVYLLFGMIFAAVYALIGHLSTAPLFAQQSSFTATDTIYYSFVTLTTVGYGDLTLTGDVARVLSNVEALLGQIYLIVAVGLLVGNLGRERRRPDLSDTT